MTERHRERRESEIEKTEKQGQEGRKEMFLFNDALDTLYLQLYGIRHIVKDHSDIERKPAAATWATLSD